MNTETDFEASFEASDSTALVCVDHQQYQKMIAPQLTDMSFKVHLGLHEEDVLLKLRTYSYDIVIVYENYKGLTLATNPILQEMIKQPGSQRRESFVVLLTHRFATNDAMGAFVQSVDQIINVDDLANFKPVLRRGMTRHHEKYHVFHSTLKAVQAM